MSDPRRPPRSLDEQLELWLLRTLVWRKGHPAPPRSPAPALPAGAPPRPARLVVALGTVALVAPVVVAAALIPLRSRIDAPTAALVMVLPVVGVALVVPRSIAVLAALSAALAFDVFLTEPYFSFTIDAAGDVEAAVVLGVIGAVVATVVGRGLDAKARSQSRAREIAALDNTVVALGAGDPDRLVEVVVHELRTLLLLERCDWSPGFHGRIGEVLARGSVLGAWSGATFPAGVVEVPVVHQGEELGRLILRGAPDRVVSNEERRTVLALADLLALGLASPPPR